MGELALPSPTLGGCGEALGRRGEGADGGTDKGCCDGGGGAVGGRTGGRIPAGDAPLPVPPIGGRLGRGMPIQIIDIIILSFLQQNSTAIPHKSSD